MIRMNLYRPTYHFLPEKNWMNDPNGPIYMDGYYHLFYQYNPTGDYWENIHWGHARSKDLMHWEHLPVALAPSRNRGEEHCFSGCAVLEGDKPTAIYTSVGTGNRNARYGSEQWMARSSDGGITWCKSAQNPILTADIHPGEKPLEWRDPFVWKENGRWKMVLGGSLHGKGCILLYQAEELTKWEYAGVLYEDDTYPFLECPNLLTFGEKRLLFYSPNDFVRYHIGSINQIGRFVEEKNGVLDHGKKTFYAPNTLLNAPDGRQICWGWLQDSGRGSTFSGWAGVMSLPRVLSLENGELMQDPAVEYKLLRREEETLPVQNLHGEKAVFTCRGRALELFVEAEVDKADDFSVVLLSTLDGREETRIHYVAALQMLTLERGLSSMALDVDRSFYRMRLAPENSRISLHIFLDHSIVEIFANHREVLTGRVYPTQVDSDHISVEGSVRQITASLWLMGQA